MAGGDSNLYRYTGNDPSNLVDPSGLSGGAPTGGAVSLTTAVMLTSINPNHGSGGASGSTGDSGMLPMLAPSGGGGTENPWIILTSIQVGGGGNTGSSNGQNGGGGNWVELGYTGYNVLGGGSGGGSSSGGDSGSGGSGVSAGGGGGAWFMYTGLIYGGGGGGSGSGGAGYVGGSPVSNLPGSTVITTVWHGPTGGGSTHGPTRPKAITTVWNGPVGGGHSPTRPMVILTSIVVGGGGGSGGSDGSNGNGGSNGSHGVKATGGSGSGSPSMVTLTSIIVGGGSNGSHGVKAGGGSGGGAGSGMIMLTSWWGGNGGINGSHGVKAGGGSGGGGSSMINLTSWWGSTGGSNGSHGVKAGGGSGGNSSLRRTPGQAAGGGSGSDIQFDGMGAGGGDDQATGGGYGGWAVNPTVGFGDGGWNSDDDTWINPDNPAFGMNGLTFTGDSGFEQQADGLDVDPGMKIDAVDHTQEYADIIFGYSRDPAPGGNPYGMRCFPAGTPVATEDGLLPIEEVQVGDRVWAFDHADETWQLRSVLECYQSLHEGNLVVLEVAGETITSTPGHPFWVIEGRRLRERPLPEHASDGLANSCVPGRWVNAGDLQIGDVLLLKVDRFATITTLKRQPAKDRVFNFHVEGLHCYAVGTKQILVHNNSAMATPGNVAPVPLGPKWTGPGFQPPPPPQKPISLWGAFKEGWTDGGVIQIDRLTGGRIPAAHQMAQDLIAKNGGAYVASGYCGDIARASLMTYASSVGFGVAGKAVGFAGGIVGKGIGLSECTISNIGNAAQLGGTIYNVGSSGAGVIGGGYQMYTGYQNGDTDAMVQGGIDLGTSSIGLLGGLQSLNQEFQNGFGACFAAGTKLLTPNGFKAIEDFQVGDLVISAPEDDPEAVPSAKRVELLITNEAELWILRVGGHEIQTTAAHPFYVRGREWQMARDLKPGDLLRSADGSWNPVSSIEETSVRQAVYNLSIAHYYTYFVGDRVWEFSVWAHNAGPFCGGNAPKGSANPVVKKAAGRGSSLHSDKPGNLPDQLRQRYPDTDFDFTKPGVPGQDVKFTGGKHPSEYPESTWPNGVNHGDFKPDTPGGLKTFTSDQRKKWPDPTHMLPYDPGTGELR